MHKYELGIVLHPHMEEEAVKAEHDLILELIARFGGTVEKVDNWGKRRLAYEIKKINEGFYCFIYIDGPPEMPREIEDRLRIRENIIRFMMIRRDDIVKANAKAAAEQ
ncbi:MAG: 30S ribosomal protein S6 [Defluviitaleaceae bacterium]|nr:30S ribosomal protein S6 [Defluviitaleaceae bacterium]